MDYPDGLGKDFFKTCNAIDRKERIDKLHCIKMKNFHCQKSIKKKGEKKI